MMGTGTYKISAQSLMNQVLFLLEMEVWRRLTIQKISENKPLIYMKTVPKIALNSHP